MATVNTAHMDMAMSPRMVEKGESKQLENGGNGSNDGIDGGTNYHSYDGHTSFNRYPTHEPGFENKVGFAKHLEALKQSRLTISYSSHSVSS